MLASLDVVLLRHVTIFSRISARIASRLASLSSVAGEAAGKNPVVAGVLRFAHGRVNYRVLAAVVVAAYLARLGIALWYRFPEMHKDSLVFFTVGRGILNGIMPWTGIFEFKPPMIFFISAFSLVTTDGYRGAQFLGATLPLLPVMLALFAKDKLWTFLSASAVMLFVVDTTMNVSVEAFGAIFACSYVVVMLWETKWKYLVASVFAAAAVLTKEPIAFGILAASLALYPKVSVKECLYVLVGSVALWFAVMGSLGYLDAYFNFYIPNTFLGRVGNSLPVLTGFQVWRILPMFSSLVFVLLILTSLRLSWLILPAVFIATFAAGVAYDDPFRSIDIVAICCLFLALILHKNKLNTVVIAILPLVAFGAAAGTKWDGTQEKKNAQYIDQILDDCGVERYMHFGRSKSFTISSMKHSPMGSAVFLADYSAQLPDFVNSYSESVSKAEIILFERPEKLMGSEYFVYSLLQNEIEENFTTEPWACGKKFVTEEYALLYRKREP